MIITLDGYCFLLPDDGSIIFIVSYLCLYVRFPFFLGNLDGAVYEAVFVPTIFIEGLLPVIIDETKLLYIEPSYLEVGFDVNSFYSEMLNNFFYANTSL